MKTTPSRKKLAATKPAPKKPAAGAGYDIGEFLEANPRTSRLGAFDEQALSDLVASRAPADVIAFLQGEGRSTYRDGFLSTTLPREHFETLSAWGLKGEQCFAFLKTALGGLCFAHKGKVAQLDPIGGLLYRGRFEFPMFMNVLATMDAFAESSYLDVYERLKKKRPLAPDECFGMVPALPRGGSFDTSRFEVAKMNEQLGVLAKLYGGKAKSP